jgi:phosphopantetheinyl transferase/peptidoglycan/xylan/chitin deacetylase (PgdA/CDA1 family)
MLRALASKGLHLADGVALSMATNAHAQGDALVAVLCHSLCRDRGHLSGTGQDVTAEDFRAFVGAMLESGYAAVSPEEVDGALRGGGKHLMITFDDGYFNNTLALGVLEDFQVPATFFISCGNVWEQKAFWWDAYRHELAKAGVSAREQQVKIRTLKALAPDGIDDYLQAHFGKAVLHPHSDADRPFTPDELRDFARSKWVHLGNHTRDHAILTNCGMQEIGRQIRGCQQSLRELTGQAPIAIAYPNGNFSQEIVGASLAAGLRLGFTALPHRNKLPLAARDRMTLGRFQFEGGKDAREQCRKFSANFVPSHLVKTLIHSPPAKARELPGPIAMHGACGVGVQVWIARPADFGPGMPGDLDWLLDDPERERAARFRHEADRRAFVLAHALRRSVLARWLAVDPRTLVFGKERGGRPVLLSPRADGIYFSHSRSRDTVACAVTRMAPIGIDVEAVLAGEVDDALIARFVVPRDDGELHAPAEHDRTSRFCFQWTALEAFWKAEGKGLADGNPRIECRDNADGQLEVWLEGNPQGPRARLYPVGHSGGACITLALCSTVEADPQLFNANMQLFNGSPAHEMLSLR